MSVQGNHVELLDAIDHLASARNMLDLLMLAVASRVGNSNALCEGASVANGSVELALSCLMRFKGGELEVS